MGSDDDEAPKKKKAISKKNTQVNIMESGQTTHTGVREDTSKISIGTGGFGTGGDQSSKAAAGGAGDGDMESQITRIVEKIISERAGELDDKFKYWHEEVNTTISIKFYEINNQLLEQI